MSKFRLTVWLPTELNICPTSLEIKTVRAGGYFSIAVLGWHPYLNIVCFGRSKAHVTCTKQYYMIWQLQDTQNILRIIHHFFQFIPGILWLSKLYKLHLVKLMLANKSTGIPPSTTCLSSVAGGICTIVLRKRCPIYYFLAMVVCCRNLSCRHHIIIQTFQLKHILRKLRQLSCTNHTVLINNAWRQHLSIAMLGGMQIHHKVYKGTL